MPQLVEEMLRGWRGAEMYLIEGPALAVAE